MKKLFVLILAIFLQSETLLASEKEAKIFINNIASKVISIMNDDQVSDKDKQTTLIEIFKKSVDINWIGKFALGRYAKNFNQDQKNRYEKLFEMMLIKSYIPSFKQYTNEKFQINNVVSSGKGEYIVQTEIVRNNKKNNIKVSYAVRETIDNNLKIYDIIVEDTFSLIGEKRNEFSGILAEHDINYLLTELDKKSSQSQN